MKKSRIWGSVIGLVIISVNPPTKPSFADEPISKSDKFAFEIKLDTIQKGYDGKSCWVHPRAGLIPGKKPIVVLTMMKAIMSGSDVFLPIADIRTDDLGQSWSKPHEHTETFSRLKEPNNVECGVCDFTPAWHAKSGKLLAIGQTVRYQNNTVMKVRSRETAYSIYDPEKKSWSQFDILQMPNEPRFYNCGAGSVQRYDLSDGTILLPVYFRKKEDTEYKAAILKCEFDGKKLTYQRIGNEQSIQGGRGLYEPSITKFRDRYYLTLRNDTAGYVATSTDGLTFSKPKTWTWDDGTPLGNYNTQQHWVTHSDGLFLVYTRKGAKNDHVFRHRAPLFIAQVDPEKLHVLQSTERILVPERGARLGNFGVVDISPNETWVTVAEWMQSKPPNIVMPVDNPYGADNSVYVARIRWKQPNRSFQRSEKD